MIAASMICVALIGSDRPAHCTVVGYMETLDECVSYLHPVHDTLEVIKQNFREVEGKEVRYFCRLIK